MSQYGKLHGIQQKKSSPEQDTINFSEKIYTDDEWDQRNSLRPPPYTGAMTPLLKGLEIGDTLLDDFSIQELLRAVHKNEHLPQLNEPSWVNWNEVRKGQELWKENIASAYAALAGALLAGFSIARFADVLVMSGYTRSVNTTWERFKHTNHHVMDWFLYPLDDPKSFARCSIYHVRAMHAVARKKSRSAFSRDHGEGIPLSQYDMAEVQLGFTIVCLIIMTKVIGRKLSRDQLIPMIHMWRLIGWHLGILDEFNCCNSLSHLEDLYDDYMYWTPLRYATSRESTYTLRRYVCDAFGSGTGLGVHYWEGYLSLLLENGQSPTYLTYTTSQRTVQLNSIKEQIRKAKIIDDANKTKYPRTPLIGMSNIVLQAMKKLQSNSVQSSATLKLIEARELWRSNPTKALQREKFQMRMSHLMDIMWQLISMFVRAKMFLVKWRKKIMISMFLILIADRKSVV